MTNQFIHAATAGLIAVAMTAAPCEADWINVTGAEVSPNIAEIYVERDHVKILLEVFIGDLESFEGLIPDDWLKDTAIKRPSSEERIRRFARETLQVQGPDGEPLEAKLDLVEPRIRVDRWSPFAGAINPFTLRRSPSAPEDKRVLYAELTYALEGRPDHLTFVPPLDEEGRPRISIGFIAYHKSVPVIDFRYMGAPVVLNLDWDDPWYSKFENPVLKRHHKDAIMSFLYVEPFEVRHEVLTRVKDMADWMDLGLRGDEFIEIDELEPLKQRIGAFLMTKNPVLIDGQTLTPILDRSRYVKVGVKGIQFLDTPGRMEISTAIVGVIVAFVTKGLPQEVTVEWELFSERIVRVPATAIDPAGPLASYLEPEARVHKWTNFLKKYEIPTVAPTQVAGTLPALRVPVAAVLCLGALWPVAAWFRRRRRRRRGKPTGPALAAGILLVAGAVLMRTSPFVAVARPAALPPALDSERAATIVESLLENVYRSFDFREESDVYDKLETSVSGDLLADVYLQSRRSLLVEQAGGAQARLESVAVIEAIPTGPIDGALAYDVRTKWTTAGKVGHWGHVHHRENAYEANLRIEAREGNWKLAGLELLDEQRIDPAAAPAPEPVTASQQ